jgi:alcohol oxidase
VGVEVHSSKEKGKDTRAIRASREVILCCGALGTPGVLERSGVGSPEVLKRAGVNVKVDLPGVGKGLDDHQVSMMKSSTVERAHS